MKSHMQQVSAQDRTHAIWYSGRQSTVSAAEFLVVVEASVPGTLVGHYTANSSMTSQCVVLQAARRGLGMNCSSKEKNEEKERVQKLFKSMQCVCVRLATRDDRNAVAFLPDYPFSFLLEAKSNFYLFQNEFILYGIYYGAVSSDCCFAASASACSTCSSLGASLGFALRPLPGGGGW